MSTRPWLQHYDDGVPVDLDFEPRPLDTLLTSAAHVDPDKTALVYFDHAITYGELDRTVEAKDEEISELKTRLEKLEALVESLTAN